MHIQCVHQLLTVWMEFNCVSLLMLLGANVQPRADESDWVPTLELLKQHAASCMSKWSDRVAACATP